MKSMYMFRHFHRLLIISRFLLFQPCRITAIFSTDSLEEQEELEEFAETDAKDKNNEEEQEPETPIAVSIIIEKEGSQGANAI